MYSDEVIYMFKINIQTLSRTQASLCKKTAMCIWRVYMKYCSGERRAKGLMGRVIII
jgi:hypothetical protein